MNTEKIMKDIQSVQDNIREIKSTWGNTIMTLDNIKSGLKADVQKKVDEAYQRGHDDGYEAGCATAFKPVSDAEYQRGLDDAWEAARKIAVNMGVHERARVFFQDAEAVTHEELFKSYSAQEAIDKIKAYENKKIHVGDFVSHNDVPEIIVLVTYVGLDNFTGIAVTDVEDRCRKGEAYTYYNSGNWHKIDIQLVKGEDNA